MERAGTAGGGITCGFAYPKQSDNIIETGAEGKVMCRLTAIAILLIPSIGSATSERPPVEPVKSEISQKLVFTNDHIYIDTFGPPTFTPPVNTAQKKQHAKKPKSKSKLPATQK